MSQVVEATQSEPGNLIPATKLHIPRRREGLIKREALVERLVESAAGKLALVDAPPGFGKTTLVAEWCAAPREERPFAWVSLDDADNDPVRFWGCVISSLGTIESGLGESARGALATPNVDLTDLALPILINELAALRSPIVIALDDYHLIRSDQVHSSVAYLLDHLPRTVQLVIATRSDPPLPLGRLRAGGELTEIRAAELRLSNREAAGLLEAAVGVELDPADVARLQERTEGWAAGLYLAALSLRGRDDARAFIDSFTGDDRQLVDYLSAEVLNGQPDDLREFLLETSILDRLCAAACDAVTTTEASRGTLEQIERSNLFLVPLDNTREWYRYHHLFGELLRHELERTKPGLVGDLHGRAQAWHFAQGMVPEAISHAIAGGAIEAAGELIAEEWNDLFNQGRLDTVAGWLDALPSQVVLEDPRLCVARAWLALDRARLDEAAEWIGSAAAAEGDRTHGPDVAVLQAVHGFKVGDLATAREAAARALDAESADDSFPRFVALCIAGISRYWSGEADEALAALDPATEIARSTGNDLGHSYALGYLALLKANAGRPDDAERLAGTAVRISDDPGFVEHFVTMIGHMARGTVELGRGRLERAGEAFERALELARRGAGALELAAALASLAEVRQLAGARDEAKAHAAEARRILEACADPGVLAHTLGAVERSLRAGGRRAETAARAEELTDREAAVLRLLDSSLSRREIADALYVSLDTVKTHTRSIYRKLEVPSREEAVSRARELGLL